MYHINKAGEFDPKKCGSQARNFQPAVVSASRNSGVLPGNRQGHPDADSLLWRGVEMVEILSTLSMISTRRGGATVPSGRRQRSQRRCTARKRWQIYRYPDSWRARYGGAIRQLNATITTCFLRSRLITSVECYWRMVITSAAWHSNWPSESNAHLR